MTRSKNDVIKIDGKFITILNIDKIEDIPSLA